jgi:uncharacterized integral membrane protein
MEFEDKPKNYGWKILSLIVILLLIVIFSVQNSTETLVKILFWEGNAPLVLLMVFCFALGLSFALIAIWPISRHSKRKTKLIREMELRIDLLEQEIKRKESTNS